MIELIGSWSTTYNNNWIVTVTISWNCYKNSFESDFNENIFNRNIFIDSTFTQNVFWKDYLVFIYIYILIVIEMIDILEIKKDRKKKVDQPTSMETYSGD